MNASKCIKNVTLIDFNENFIWSLEVFTSNRHVKCQSSIPINDGIFIVFSRYTM